VNDVSGNAPDAHEDDDGEEEEDDNNKEEEGGDEEEEEDDNNEEEVGNEEEDVDNVDCKVIQCPVVFMSQQKTSDSEAALQ
jgi:hypothetical protein